MTDLSGYAPRWASSSAPVSAAIADALTDATAIPYAELEGFPQPSVAGHGGTLHFGELERAAGRRVPGPQARLRER